MAINFTDSPADGATQVISGRTYTYNSAKNKWDTTATEVVGPTATVYATVNDLPGTATTGDQAFVSGTNRLYIWNGSGWYNIALVNSTPTWTTQPDSSYTLASDGTATTITIVATDPEGLPITYSIASDTSGNIATVAQGTGLQENTWTITPSTSDADAGTFSLTFRASDGVNVASAISEFTLAFKVQNSNYTTALITSVGANNAVNNTFVDSSSNSHTITAAGNATQSTFSPYRHGGYSTYFDGSGDYFSAGSNSAFAFGTGDFTIEGWVYRTGNAGGNGVVHIICDTRLTNGGPGVALQVNSSTGALSYYDSTEKIAAGSAPSNTWTHYAVSRSGSTVRGFINGVQVGSATITTNYTDSSSLIGTNIPQNNSLNGYLSDVRIVKGTAVYTSAFTPPTERLTAITNTSLLTCHLPYIADGSTNSHSITINGNTHTRPFSPYDYETYSAADNGGSMYFDGNGDYVKVTNTTTSVSGDFTIECWLNFNSYRTSGANSRVFCMKPGGNTADNLQLIVDMGTPGIAGSVSIWTNAYTAQASTPIDDDSWHHIAVTRESGTVKIYIDGTLEGSGSNSTTFDFSGHKIGTRDETADTASKFTGSIADFRTVVGTAVYTSNFTPPTAPLTDVTNTLALVRGTNAGIIDKSQTAKTLTLNGDVKSSTTQTKYLSSSMAFDGNGDIILFDASDPLYNLSYGQGDFTLEGWFYFNSLSNNPKLYIDGASTSTYWQLYYVNNTGLTFRANNTGINVNAGSTLSVNTWYHIALVRNSSTYNIYVDGTSIVSTTTTHQIGSNGEKALGGSVISGASYSLNGYISDFRITKGLARYTADFTPPTAALQG